MRPQPLQSVDAVETATFGAFALVLAEYGIAEKAREMNETAARLAREVADEFEADGRPRFVIGSIGPGTRLPSLGAITLELRQVPRGTFMMGSAAAEATHEKDEEPAHQVTIAREVWVGKTPVTRGQFAKFVADTHYVTEAEKGQTGGAGWDGKELKQKKEYTWKNPGFTQAEDHPVVMITFGDATAFASWASRNAPSTTVM